MTKPCHPEELLARIQAVLRRRRAGELPVEEETIEAGEIAIRPDRYDAYVGEQGASLSRKEFELLRQLAAADGRVLEREDIYQRVWGYTMARGDRSVDVFVRKLRQKLEQISPGWRYVHTHFGVGYRFAAEPIDGGGRAEPRRRRRTAPAPATPTSRRGTLNRRGTLELVNSTVRNVLIVLALAAIVGTLSGRRHRGQRRDPGGHARVPGDAVLVRLAHVPPAPEHAVLARRRPSRGALHRARRRDAHAHGDLAHVEQRVARPRSRGWCCSAARPTRCSPCSGRRASTETRSVSPRPDVGRGGADSVPPPRALGAQALEQHVGPLHLEPGLAERHVDAARGRCRRGALQLPAPEVVVRRDVGVELPWSGALDDAEQAGLGQLPERVVDGGPRQLGELRRWPAGTPPRRSGDRSRSRRTSRRSRAAGRSRGGRARAAAEPAPTSESGVGVVDI